MSSQSIQRRIVELEAQMAAAASTEDFELAAALRNQILELKGQQPAALVRQPPPGQMGLGTHIPVTAPPKNWRRPKKPDPMTRGNKGKGR